VLTTIHHIQAAGRSRRGFIRIAANPVAVFMLLSAIFGSVIIAAAPPLRGPDESQHFLRAYGIAQGDLVPSMQDAAARRGIAVPVPFHRDFSLFHSWQSTNRGERFNYRRVFEEYRDGGIAPMLPGAERQTVFIPYAGSEGYSPAAYLPQAAAAVLARAAELGFLATFYLMRMAGFAAMSAVVAYAIALTPTLKWPFVAIAMLPSALYGRAVINADAAAFAYGLLIVAMFLRAAMGATVPTFGMRSAWMILCVLSKPANLAFVLLEGLRATPKEMRCKWRAATIAVVPAVAASLLWTAVSSADVAAWRLVEISGAAPQEFEPAWKLRFMLAHPLDFPAALLGTLQSMHLVEFWHQVIGVLGMFDTVLRPWVYTAVGLLLAATFVSPLGGVARTRCALAALIATLAYCLAVTLIFYLVWTPAHADQIWGVQGRYFVPVLPLIAVAVAAVLNCGPDVRFTAALAIAAAVISGAGSIDAIARADWNS
jgi:uncharacterized membrane protein